MKFFNSSKKWRFASSSITKYILAALLSLAGVQGVLAQYYVAGDGWTCGENGNPSGCEMSQSRNVYVYDSPVLAAGTYLFKITNGTSNTTWGWSEVYSSRCTAIVADAGGDDQNVKITLNESSTVKIIFNPNAAAGKKITVYAGITPLYIRGDVNSWGDPSDWQGVSTDGINYTWKGTLLPTGNDGNTNLGGAFKIATAVYANVNGNDTWYWDDNFDFGGEGSGTSIQISDTGTTTATLKAKTETGGNGNLSLSGNLQYSGAVYATRITFNISTKELVIYTAPITPTADSYVVEWAEPVYDSAAGSLMLQAAIAASETAGFTLDQASGMQAQINVHQGGASSGRVSLPDGEGQYVVSHTVTGVQAGSTVNYSLQIVTGGGSKIVLPSDVANINPQAYTVPESVEPGTVSLYLIGSGTSAQWDLAKALPFTYENGVYTWTGDLTVNKEAFKILTSNTEWEPAYVAETDQFEVVLGEAIALYYREKSGDNQYTRDDNKFKITEGGEYTIKVTLGGDNSGSMIVTKKSDPVYAATITAEASASQGTARQVVLTSSLTETSASTDLSAATCQFQYLSADAAEGTEYSNLDARVAYNAEGASLTTTALPQGGKYLFRAVWTLNGEVVATSDPSEATCVYPIWPEPEMFDVVWIPTYNTSDGSVTITAEISAKEDACFVMGQIVGLVANIFVGTASPATSMSNPSGAENNKATATATIQNVNEGQELAYRLEFTTGASQQVLGRGGIQIPGGTYVVEAPEVHNSTVYLRGDINGWAYDGIDDKYVGKTYDDVNVFWDWSGSPVEFVTTGESGGSKFKFDDTKDGEWETGQWSGGDQDAWIGEEQISNNEATLTTVNDDKNGAFYLVPEICPATIRRIDLNVETNQLVITFDSYKKEFKDLWFRSLIVEGGWGDGISDPLGYGVNPKYQGQTSDGKTYTWNWSGSNAVTIEAGTPFKFGEYTGNASWGNTAYGGLNAEDRNFTSADFGNPLQTIAAAGYEFSPAQKVTITGVTLDTESMTVVFEGEAYVERFPVTVNKVNGENGSVVTDPSDITNMAIGETVTVTATAKEGYVALFEATSGCVMKDGSADNIKVFEITAAKPVITVTFQVQCQSVAPNFTISGQFNADFVNDAVQYAGTAISSKNADPKDGIWSDGTRSIQLTANGVPANYFKWECVGYAIDGHAVEIPKIAWTGNTTTSAHAELSLPGTYSFVCDAKCNLDDDWTRSDTLTITAPAPKMGFDGPAFVGSSWDHASAGIDGQGLMTRQPGTMIWKSRVLNVANFGGEFVVIQRYKTLGCVSLAEGSSDPESKGWTGHEECGKSLSRPDNKVNRAETLSFKNITGSTGANFVPSNPGTWAAGADGTDLQLVVTMIGYDSYTVALEEVSQECTTPADNFAISARLNQGAGAPFEGNLVASDSNTATGGYFADGFRTVTLTTTQVADTYEWKLVSYAIDGNAQATADLTTLATITNGEAQTATALLSRPGDYTFQCTAACTDGTPVNSATVTISTYPEMGFDGPIGTPASVSENGWNHAWAGQSGNGLLVRENGSLKWSLTFVYQGVGSTPNDFVVIQRYKRGCVTAPDGGEQGWAGFTECGVIVPGEPDFWGNKINASIIDLASGLGYASTTEGDNFRANDLADEQGWVAGVTELTLTVTMTDWDSYTVKLAKKQEQIYAYYSSNSETMGTVAMKVGDIPIDYGDDITGYIGQQVTLTATPAPGYKVASWKINGKVTESDRPTITPMLSGKGLNVVVTFERDCYSGVVYDLTGGGVICANGGSTELSLNTLNNVTYQLYKDGVAYGTAVKGNGEAAKWTISEAGTYTAKSYDSRFEECQEQAIDMNGSADVTTVTAPEITVNPGKGVHLTVLQARSFTTEVPVDWSITDVSSEGGYCTGDGYMISSKTDTSLVAKFLCIGTAKITATMKAPNQNCKAEVTVHQNGAEMENCAPEPEDVQ